MLIVFDDYKEKLDQADIQYVEYDTPANLYLNYVLNATLELAMKYNEANIKDKNTVDKYVKYLANSEEVEKIYSKLEKFEFDAIKLVSDIVDGKHDEIMKETVKGVDNE